MLYRQYRTFMTFMASDRKREVTIKNEDEFNAWMSGLDMPMRESLAEDFRRGYWATVAHDRMLLARLDGLLEGSTEIQEEVPKPWSNKPVAPPDAPFTCTLCGVQGHIAKICPHNKAFRVIAGLDK